MCFRMWTARRKVVETKKVLVTLQEQVKKPQKAQEVSDLHAGTCGKVIIAQGAENLEQNLSLN